MASGLEPSNLPWRVMNTIPKARAHSVRHLYMQKWALLMIDPISCEIASILSFLQELLVGVCTPSTLKVYTAAIAAIAGQSIGKHNLMVRFLTGARRLNPPHPNTDPSWDLSIILRALWGTLLEPFTTANLRFLSLKSPLLLALTSVK